MEMDPIANRVKTNKQDGMNLVVFHSKIGKKVGKAAHKTQRPELHPVSVARSN